MDSGNSGSLQSSSGGDEEYDSRATVDSISNFMTTHQPSTHLRPISAPPPPLFDPLSNYLQLHQNPNPVWPGMQRSDPNSTTLDIINSPHFFQPPAADNNHGVPPPPQNPNHTAARNPKKRSRASRRAPTTVLTTDTTNFRAMVQEFTGIPAAPFSNSSFPPPYLRRPFAQKVQSPPSFLGSSSSSLLNSTTALDSSTTQNSNLFNNNIPNPFLASLLQTNPKFIFNKLPEHHQGSFEIPPSNDHRHSNIKMDGLDYVTGLPNLISSDPRNDNNNNNNNNSNAVGPDEGDHRDDYEARMRSVNGGYNFTRKTTSSAVAAAANFNGEKMGSETTTRGGEGMVESWICSSELK